MEHPSSPRGRVAALFVLLAVHAALCAAQNATSAPTPSLSGCQVCAASGDCSHAYLDGPGQFCGNWLDLQSQRQRCCCPRDAACKVSNYACKCSRTDAVSGGGGDRGGASIPVWASAVITVGSLFMLAVVLAYCCCATSQPPVQGAVYASVPVYATPGVSYGAPYAYGFSNDYDRTDAGTGAMVGGAAGLIAGLMVGEAIADAGDGGYDGGGGGYDGGGDFGGDF